MTPFDAMQYSRLMSENNGDWFHPKSMHGTLMLAEFDSFGLPNRQSEVDTALQSWDQYQLLPVNLQLLENAYESSEGVRPSTNDQATNTSSELSQKVAVAEQYALRARVLYGMGVFDLAERDLERSLKWHENETVSRWRAENLIKLGRIEDAMTIMESQISKTTKRGGWLMVRAHALLAQNQLEESLKDAESAVKIDSSFENAATLIRWRIESKQLAAKKIQLNGSSNAANDIDDRALTEALTSIQELRAMPEGRDRDEKLLQHLKTITFAYIQRQSWELALDAYDMRIEISKRIELPAEEISGLISSKALMYFRELHDIPKASQLVAEATELYEHDCDALELMSIILLDANEYDFAINVARDAVKAAAAAGEQPSDAVLLVLSVALKSTGKLTNSIPPLLQLVLNEDGEHADKGRTFLLQEFCQLCSSRDLFQAYDAETNSGENPVEQNKHAQIIGSGLTRLILEASTKLVLLDEPAGHRNRSEWMIALGHPELATTDLQAIVKRSDANSNDWLNYAQCLYAEQQNDEALHACEKSLALTPRNPNGYLFRANFQAEQLGRVPKDQQGQLFETSMKDFERTLVLLKADQQNTFLLPAFYLNRANALLRISRTADDKIRMKSLDQAKSDCDEAIKLVGEDDWEMKQQIESLNSQLESELSGDEGHPDFPPDK